MDQRRDAQKALCVQSKLITLHSKELRIKPISLEISSFVTLNKTPFTQTSKSATIFF